VQFQIGLTCKRGIETERAQFAWKRQLGVGVGSILEIQAKGGVKERAVVVGFQPEEREIADERQVGQCDVEVELELGIGAGWRGLNVKSVGISADFQMEVVGGLDVHAAGERQSQSGQAGIEIGGDRCC